MAFARPVTLLQSTESQFRTYAHRQRKNEYQAPFENYQPHRASARRLIGLEKSLEKQGQTLRKSEQANSRGGGDFYQSRAQKRRDQPAG
jgi:hypothetical protein